MPHPKCFHNGIVLIVICFKLVTQRMNNFYYHVYLWKNINIFGVL